MYFRSTFPRCATAVMTFHFLFATLPTRTLGAWVSKTRESPPKPWTCSPVTHGQAISGSCRILWNEQCCYLKVPHCEYRWVKSLLTRIPAQLVAATRWNKPRESRLCERSAKATGLWEAPGERQLAWASRGQHSPTRCRSSESFGRHSDRPLAASKRATTLSHQNPSCILLSDCRASLSVYGTTT